MSKKKPAKHQLCTQYNNATDVCSVFYTRYTLLNVVRSL